MTARNGCRVSRLIRRSNGLGSPFRLRKSLPSCITPRMKGVILLIRSSRRLLSLVLREPPRQPKRLPPLLRKEGSYGSMYDVAIRLENKPGEMARMGEALGAAGVSVEGG